MKTIIISSHMKLCLSEKDGKVLRDIIETELEKEDSICLDFSNIALFASPFFNISLGYLVGKLSPEEYNKKVSVNNLSTVGEKTYTKVIENAIDYYSSSNRKQLDDIVNSIEE